MHKVAAALGSNLGDRFGNTERALRLLEHPFEVFPEVNQGAYTTVVDTSFMYETEPMSVTDQPKFINCACLVSSLRVVCDRYKEANAPSDRDEYSATIPAKTIQGDRDCRRSSGVLQEWPTRNRSGHPHLR